MAEAMTTDDAPRPALDAAATQEQREYGMQTRLNVLLDLERRLAAAALNDPGACEQADVSEAGYAALRERRDRAFVDLARDLAAAARAKALASENDRLRHALGWYANRSVFDREMDGGKRARTALAPAGGAKQEALGLLCAPADGAGGDDAS